MLISTVALAAFLAARPVWPEGRAETVNDFVRFRAAFGPATGAVLRVTGSSAYRIRLNGGYVGYGPARGPKGFFRVDEWPLAAAATNALEIDVAGYNCKSYCFQDQPSFLQAEVVADGRVLAATGRDGAFAAHPTDRVRRVSRYSYQRTFAEAYRVGSSEGAKPYALVERPPVRLLPRIAPYPSFAQNCGVRVLSRADATPNPLKRVKEFPNAGARADEPWRTGFRPEDFEVDIRRDGLFVDFANRRPSSESGTVPLAAGTSVQLDAGLNDCGFPGLTVEVTKPGKLLWTFDEVLTDGEVDAARMNCCNAVEWIFDRPGRYRVEAFEPYVWRYANLFTPDGEMRVSDLHVRTYKNPSVGRATFRSSDPALEKVFAAAKETFAQNAVDVFTDCPSRERAGWLCDSFFIGRVNRLLTGNADLERLFLQNYALPEVFDDLPEGMVPMCYPADHRNGNFIPNWAMWLVLETEEYLARSGDRATVETLRPRLTALVDYLKTFRNADGLLEKLPKWVFVEWSRANRLVQDVNYPTNMMWAEVLDAMARLYGLPELAAEAGEVRETVRRQSWTGTWFCDNAVRQTDGSLKLSGECTETCQYYAFFFRSATPTSHPKLWRTLVDDFGPKRLKADGKTLKSNPEIWPSNAFIGNYLRLECLSREGLLCNVYDETKDFFLYMAERTGTLWENITPSASCDHGFASHVAVTLYREFLGVREIDSATKTVRIVPPRELPVDWCEGEVPLSATETLKVSVRRGEGGCVKVEAVLPPGWTRLNKGEGV